MSNKLYEFLCSLHKFCRTMKITTQPYQLNPISMVYQLKLPAYECSNTINKITKRLG